MLVQAILVGLVGAFGCLDYQLGTLYAFRPIVLCPLVGRGAGGPADRPCRWRQLELLFMGSISIGATYRLTKPSAACSPARLPFSSVRYRDGHRARHAYRRPFADDRQHYGCWILDHC